MKKSSAAKQLQTAILKMYFLNQYIGYCSFPGIKVQEKSITDH
jgi:hypothetical protein